MNKSFKRLPLGLPLTVSGIATIATIFTGKKLHVAFGAVWGLLSILHGLQHAGKLEHDVKAFAGKTARKAVDKAESISLHAFLAGTDIASYLPGRIRVYNLALAGNACSSPMNPTSSARIRISPTSKHSSASTPRSADLQSRDRTRKRGCDKM